MASETDLRAPHPCLGPRCGHPEDDHVWTPELAGPTELVVWCVSCRRHEVRRVRRFWRHSRSDLSSNRVTRLTRPS